MLTRKEIAIIQTLVKEDKDRATYPAELETQTQKGLTRSGARLACERLVKMGILKRLEKRSPTWSKPTIHYSLREDKEGFIKLANNYFSALAKSDPYTWQVSGSFFIASKYAKRQIDPNLVRDILASKNVIMPLLVKMGKKVNTSSKKGISRDFQNFMPISFPVMPSGVTVKDMASQVTIHRNELTEDEKEIISKVIADHYNTVERETLILSILALLQISPSALEHFIGDWKPYVRDEDSMAFHSGSQGFDMIEHVLFRLVWNAINDLSLIRGVPEKGNVYGAYVSGGKYLGSKPSSLLRLRCRDNLSIEYEAGFDTDHDYYGDEGGDIVEIETNPANCGIKIALKKEIKQ